MLVFRAKEKYQAQNRCRKSGVSGSNGWEGGSPGLHIFCKDFSNIATSEMFLSYMFPMHIIGTSSTVFNISFLVFV